MVTVAVALWLMFASDGSDAHARGVALYKQEQYAASVSTLQQAIQTERPGDAKYAESALLIGNSYFLMAQASKAIPWLEKVTDVREANYMLGYAYVQVAEPDRSVAAFARVFNLKPGSAAAHLVAGQMMLKQQYEMQAGAEIGKAIAMEPDIPEAHFLLAEIEIRQEHLAEALANLQKELRINPNYAMAWYRLGDLYVRQQEYELAITNLQRAVWLNSAYSAPYILLGKCYFRQQQYEKGITILRGALRIDPQNRQATYLLGQTLIAAGRKQEGRTLLKGLNYSTGEP